MTSFHFPVFLLLSVLFVFFFHSDGDQQDKMITAFNAIQTNPEVISFYNSKEVNNSGGHLQGIQRYVNKSGEYVFLSGSSDTYAYYAIAELGEKNKVLSVNKLMDKPFKHAGGFQIFHHYMAVGIEDNSEKDKSKVCIYDISEPEKPATTPIAIIERIGAPQRSTAGCVGITKYKNDLLVAVGDWDTKHIDFYTCPFESVRNQEFEKISAIDTKTIPKKGWIENCWHSYQNINLFTSGNNLFLIGLGQNTNGENIADLFSVSEVGSKNFRIVKQASKSFNCTDKVNFRAGAGAVLEDDGNIFIISCGHHLESASDLNLFKN